ncbi:SMP-30/gluconolactonase/LRE family protein [Alkalicoccus halolimnae]|uniref:Regucalcin n=1 Tax=Alkalicoccus halolimnae TaxID=1667239 RepID=A0A5C7F7C2_9BACI|nr:SMP-30/gluconolactonase/LRE family protein [Alkalicoccus halolimnae]TXF85903.1 SMP-30/gluconolactonase/LRE family protein [Alkalicoccus halolimnae]
MKEAALVLDAKAILAEGPSWDEQTQQLIWVDINGHKINLFDPVTGKNQSFDTGQHACAAVRKESGGMMVTLRDGFYSFNPKTKELTSIYDPESHLSGNRFNDGKCDPQGRFWAGTMVLEGEEGDASLYRLDPDLSVHTMLKGATVSNGMAWDPAKNVMYYIDTPTKKIMAYDYHPDTGYITNGRTAVAVSEERENPDGMTIDDEGMLWTAFFGGWGVVRFNPETGEALSEISVPAAQVTSCTFGGAAMDELYITTARDGLSDEDLKDQPHAGGIFMVKPGVSGAPSYPFRG